MKRLNLFIIPIILVTFLVLASCDDEKDILGTRTHTIDLNVSGIDVSYNTEAPEYGYAEIPASGADFVIEGIGEYAKYAYIWNYVVYWGTPPDLVDPQSESNGLQFKNITRQWGSIEYEKSEAPCKIKVHITPNDKTLARTIYFQLGGNFCHSFIEIKQAAAEVTPK